ncbi:MAG: hypothetical protein H0V70_20815 [Ktedonobacteraceae bacterium]|nr:hypothetical protein [Ktedonobacteraceae bacterium]
MAGYERTGNPQVHVRQIVSLPGPGTAFGGVDKIWTFSSTNVWVQGSNLTDSMYEQFQQVTQHFDGKQWTSYLPTFPGYEQIVSSSFTNTWAIGNVEAGPHGHAIEMEFLDHFDGHAWKNVSTVDTGYSGIGPMTVSGNDFWYVTDVKNQGYQTSIHHYSPLAGWHDITTAGLPTTNVIEKLVVVSPIDIWVTLGDQRVFHYNGLSWHETPIQPLYSLADISATSSTDAWISGTSTAGEAIVEHWNGKTWQKVPLTPYLPSGFVRGGLKDQVQGLFAFSRTDAWVIISIYPSGSPLFFFEHWNGSKWTLYTTPQYLPQYGVAPLLKEHALGVVTGNSASQELVALTP